MIESRLPSRSALVDRRSPCGVTPARPRVRLACSATAVSTGPGGAAINSANDNPANGDVRTDRTSAGSDDDDPTFEIVMRGYERRQVDHFVARRLRMEKGLRAALAEVENRLVRAIEQAEAGADENRRLRAELTATARPGTDGFGARAEKLLRLAESEVADMRAGATRESTALIERARVTAEQHRHESEQALIARSRELDHEARRRATELDDREEKAAQQLAAGRAESERLRAAATEAAAKVRDEAQAEAALLTARARAEAGRTREEARIELDRVTALRAEVHDEFDRLGRMIEGQLAPEAAG